jgi:hypothetical protein
MCATLLLLLLLLALSTEHCESVLYIPHLASQSAFSVAGSNKTWFYVDNVDNVDNVNVATALCLRVHQVHKIPYIYPESIPPIPDIPDMRYIPDITCAKGPLIEIDKSLSGCVSVDILYTYTHAYTYTYRTGEGAGEGAGEGTGQEEGQDRTVGGAGHNTYSSMYAWDASNEGAYIPTMNLPVSKTAPFCITPLPSVPPVPPVPSHLPSVPSPALPVHNFVQILTPSFGEVVGRDLRISFRIVSGVSGVASHPIAFDSILFAAVDLFEQSFR